MPESAKLLLAVCLFAVMLCLVKMARSGHFLKMFTFSSLSGVSSLFAINLVAFLTGIKLSINWFTLIFCSFTGISGSISLLMMNVIRNITSNI